MKKRIFGRKLGRPTAHRWSMLRNMVSSLIEHERVVTTLPKAKELTRLADQMITLAKNGDLHNRRRAAAVVRGDWNVTKLFETLGPRYTHRQGGYTRVLKLSKNRAGDNAPMAVIEYVDRPGEIRAARPPAIFQQAALQSQASQTPIGQVLQQMGIPNYMDEYKEEFEDDGVSEQEEGDAMKLEDNTNNKV